MSDDAADKMMVMMTGVGHLMTCHCISLRVGLAWRWLRMVMMMIMTMKVHGFHYRTMSPPIARWRMSKSGGISSGATTTTTVMAARPSSGKDQR